MRKRAAFVFGLALLVAVPCAAADAAPSLTVIERAYADMDLEKTLKLVKLAIVQGGNDVKTTRRLYLLQGLSAAALDRADEARRAFTYVVAIDPAAKLDRNLSPKIRAPYLEARGALSGDPDGATPLTVDVRSEGNELSFELRDILAVAEVLEVWTRSSASGTFVRKSFELKGQNRFSLVEPGGAETVQYYLRLFDARRNALLELGGPEAPIAVKRPALSDSSALASPGGSDRPNRTAYHVTAGVLATLGVAAGVGSTIMYFDREDAAKTWNGPSCEVPGTTRAEQCGDIDSRRKRSELLAIGLGAGAGALLIGSAVTLLLTPADAPRNVSFEIAPDRVFIGWRSAL